MSPCRTKAIQHVAGTSCHAKPSTAIVVTIVAAAAAPQQHAAAITTYG
jgi:hypothetical protein